MEYVFSRREFDLNGVIAKSWNVSDFSLAELNYSPSLEISAHGHKECRSPDNFSAPAKRFDTKDYHRGGLW